MPGDSVPKPRKGARHTTRRQSPSGKAPRQAVTVMIADDQKLVAEVLGEWISSVPYFSTALVTQDSDELLKAAERSPPNVAVIDALMRQSFRAARWLAVRSPRTKVVVLDERHSDSHLRRAIECGAGGYLTKCDEPADFLASLARVANGGKSFPAHPKARKIGSGRLPRSTVAGHDDATPATLTARETQVLALLAEGFRVRDCAGALGISPNTVENHKARIMHKLGMHKTVDLTRFAIRHGIVSDG